MKAHARSHVVRKKRGYANVFSKEQRGIQINVVRLRYMKWQLRQLCFSRLFKFVFATQKSSKMLENVSEDEIDEISEDLGCTPHEIRDAAKEASFDLLPAKSRECTNGAFVYLGKSCLVSWQNLFIKHFKFVPWPTTHHQKFFLKEIYQSLLGRCNISFLLPLHALGSPT